MITTWNGEFLISPVPLELSLGPCSHGCAYCFSRANGYCGKNWSGSASFLRSVDRIFDGKKNDVASQLLRLGYPVNLSNRSDPFAQSNVKDIYFVIKGLRDRGVPLHISTKGGPQASTTIELIGPSVWYISLSFMDDAKRKLFEPGAPSVKERLDLIRAVVASGSRVIVGTNPLIEDWLGDFDEAVGVLKSVGASGAYYQPYHVYHDQWKAMSPRERDLMGPYYDDGKKRRIPDSQWDVMDRFKAAADRAGLPSFAGNQFWPTSFWDCMDIYPKRFGTSQNFVNWCWDNLPDNSEVFFEDFWRCVGVGMPDGLFNLDHQIHSMARSLGQAQKIPRYMTYKDLCKLIWTHKEHGLCPVNQNTFSFLVEKEGGNWIQPLDDRDEAPILLFSRKGFGSIHVTQGGDPIE